MLPMPTSRQKAQLRTCFQIVHAQTGLNLCGTAMNFTRSSGGNQGFLTASPPLCSSFGSCISPRTCEFERLIAGMRAGNDAASPFSRLRQEMSTVDVQDRNTSSENQ